MKRICRPVYGVLLFLMICFMVPSVSDAGEAGRQRTIMVYMCGSNLESSYGSASADMQEMLDADYDTASTTVLLMTGGSSFWYSGYPADKTSIVELGKKRARVVWSDDALDMGEAETLTRFLQYGMETYPAREYALVLWNHGGGPLDGVCWDELFSMDSLSLSELTSALEQAGLPGKLSWIGFDACLMGCAEVASAMAPYADYMIASQETEPAGGWNYAFLNGIEKDTDGAETGRRIVDSYFGAFLDSSEMLTLSCIDLSRVDRMRETMDAFFAPIEDGLDTESFGTISELRFSSTSFGKSIRGIGENSYDLVDLTDLVENYSKNNNGSRVLSAVDEAVVYSRSGIEGASGLSVYHPFRNKQKYLQKWKQEYKQLEFSTGYETYLEKFGTLLTGETMASWSGLQTEDQGVNLQGENSFLLQLTPEQAGAFGEAQLMILAARDAANGVYGVQISSGEGQQTNQTSYTPVAMAEAVMDENGRITARYSGRSMYVTDENGTPLLGPLPYRLSDDGQVFYIRATYDDTSGRENPADSLSVIFGGSLEEDGHLLRIQSVQAYDSISGTYTNRIPVVEEEYTRLSFSQDLKEIPDTEVLPGVEEWTGKAGTVGEIRLPMKWQFRFFDTQLSASQLYASFQVTDSQQNTYSSIPVPLTNPNLEDVLITPRIVEEEEYRVKVYLVKDTSLLAPGLNLVVEATNLSRYNVNITCEDIMLNEEQSAVTTSLVDPIGFWKLEQGETRVATFHISDTALTGMKEASSLRMKLNMYFLTRPGNYSRELRFLLQSCDLTGIAPERKEMIAETTVNGATWKLLDLAKNAYGDLTGSLCVENPGDRSFEGNAGIAVNGIMLAGGMNMVILPESRSYYDFVLRNEAEPTTGLLVNGKSSWYLAQDHLLERNGVERIESVTFLQRYGYKIKNSVTIRLDDPVEYQPEEVYGSLPEPLPLMSGEVEIQAERVLLADDGVGLRLGAVNHTDRDVSILVGERKVNGRKTSEYGEAFCVPARGRTVHSLVFHCGDIRKMGTDVLDVGMLFRINDSFSVPETHLRIRIPEDGQHYLDSAYYEAEPVLYEPPELIFLPAASDEQDSFRLEMEAEFINGDQELFSDEALNPEQRYLRLEITVTNLTDFAFWYDFSNITFNGQRISDGRWYINEVPSGEKKTAYVMIRLEQLRGLTEIRQISCEMEYYPVGDRDSKRKIKVQRETKPCPIASLLPPETEPLAVGEDADLIWELLSAEEDVSGELHFLLHGINRTDETVIRSNIEVTADGIYLAKEWLSGYVIEPGMDFLLDITADNRILVPSYEVEAYGYSYGTENSNSFFIQDHMLEQEGLREITELRIFSDIDYIGLEADPPAELCLKEPFVLAEAEGVFSGEPLSLLTGEAGIVADCVLIGDNGVSLLLELHNESSRPVYFEPESAALNGIPCGLYGTYHHLGVPPRCRMPVRISVQIEKGTAGLTTGEPVRDISVSWSMRYEDYDTFTFETPFSILKEAPLGAPGGVLVSASDLMQNLSRIRLLLYTNPEMKADSMAGVQLYPALDEEKVEAFESGTASIFMRRENAYLVSDDDPEGDYIRASSLERFCTIELYKDPEGIITAAYSGLVWMNSQNEVLESIEFPYQENKESIVTGLQMALYRDLQDFQTIPEETSLEDSEPDAYLAALCLIGQEDGKPQIEGFTADVYSAEWEEITDAAVEEDAIATAAAERQVRILKDEQVMKTIYEKYPVVSLWDLSLWRAADLQGELLVEYEITYRDGTTESLLEGYPY